MPLREDLLLVRRGLHTDTIDVTYCSYIRCASGSPLYFSNVIPAPWNPFVGTVSRRRSRRSRTLCEVPDPLTLNSAAIAAVADPVDPVVRLVGDLVIHGVELAKRYRERPGRRGPARAGTVEGARWSTGEPVAVTCRCRRRSARVRLAAVWLCTGMNTTRVVEDRLGDAVGASGELRRAAGARTPCTSPRPRGRWLAPTGSPGPSAPMCDSDSGYRSSRSPRGRRATLRLPHRGCPDRRRSRNDRPTFHPSDRRSRS